jgi:hypothetical protein
MDCLKAVRGSLARQPLAAERGHSAMLYKAILGICTLAILFNLVAFGFFQSAKYNVPLLVLISAINLWRLKVGKAQDR